jgi:nucleoside transporter
VSDRPGAETDAQPPPLAGVPLRLSVMYFLQFAVFGAQSILLAGHMKTLGFDGAQISWVYGTGALAALVSPVLAGWLADHFLPTQRIMGLCYLACAPILWWAFTQTTFPALWGAMLLFQLVHVPTMGLSNVVALYHQPDSRRIGFVRAWGTVGWVAIAWALSLHLHFWEQWQPERSHLGDGLLISAALAVVMGIVCLTWLPHTPPGQGTRRPLAFLDGFRLLAESRPFLGLFLVSLVVAVMRPFFYNLGFLFFSDPQGIALSSSLSTAVMSLGQVVEIGAMLVLAASLRLLGSRWTILLGAAALALRFGAFAWGEPVWLVIGAQTLHGVGFTFFSMGSVVAVESLAPRNRRASAQSLLVFVNSGLGALAGHWLTGSAYDHFEAAGGGHDWGGIFLIPAVGCVVACVLLLVLMRDDRPRSGNSV